MISVSVGTANHNKNEEVSQMTEMDFLTDEERVQMRGGDLCYNKHQKHFAIIIITDGRYYYFHSKYFFLLLL